MDITKTVGIDIAFENGLATTRIITCVGTNGEYYTYLAFTFGDTEVRGIWVGKFEILSSNPSSYNGGSYSITLTVRIKSNVYN